MGRHGKRRNRVAIRVRCPRCGETADIPEGALGKQGVCNRCGAMVSIPTRLNKVCFICGTDVTSTAHHKDSHGNYLCLKCWEKRDFGQEFKDTIECSVCHREMPIAEAIQQPGDPVCRACQSEMRQRGEQAKTEATAASVEPSPAAPPADDHVPQPSVVAAPPQPSPPVQAEVHETHDRPHRDDQRDDHHVRALAHAMNQGSVAPRVANHRPGPLVGVLVGVAVIFSAAAAFWAFRNSEELRKLTSRVGALERSLSEAASRHPAGSTPEPASSARKPDWEEQHTLQILLLRNQAELLVSLGRLREGIEQYDRLMKLVNGQQVSPALHEQIKQANRDMIAAQVREKREQLAAKSPATRPSENATGPIVPPVARVEPTEVRPGPTTRPAPVPVIQVEMPTLPPAPDPPTTEPSRPPFKSIFDQP